MAEETVQNYRVFLGSEFFGSEFARHPEGLSFSGRSFKLLRKKLNSCLGNYSYEQMTVRFLFTILNWPLILISFSYHENRHATHLFGSNGFENLDFVLNKAAEISTRMFSFFFCDQCRCRFLTPRSVLFSLQIQVSTKQDGLKHSLALAV